MRGGVMAHMAGDRSQRVETLKIKAADRLGL